MNWERYYQESRVIPLLAQEPYYAYVLSLLAPYLTQGISPDKPLVAALGGLHPKVTRPEHFIALCQEVFGDRPVSPFIFDQNREALADLSGVGYSTRQVQLENLPNDLPQLHLLVCDYTADFMSDTQIERLNQTLPERLHPNGLFVLTLGDSLVPSLRQFQTKIRYGVQIHYRKVEIVSRMLSNFKLIYMADTDNHNRLAVFALKGFPLPQHEGEPYGLFKDEGSFTDWFHNR